MGGRVTAASTRELARIAGLLFILTFISAIAGDILYNPALDDAGSSSAAAATTPASRSARSASWC
jgi:hypothetical protein